MKMFQVTAEVVLNFQIDENSKEFKYALEGYKQMITGDDNSTVEEMLMHAAHHFINISTIEWVPNAQHICVDGCGYVSNDDIRAKPSADCFARLLDFDVDYSAEEIEE